MAEQQYLTFDYQMARRRRIFEALSEAVYYVFNNEVEGHIAEFGSGTGFSTRTIASAMSNYGKIILKHVKPDRIDAVRSGFPSLYFFDSFEGLPPAENAVDLASPYVVSGRWHEGRFADVGKDELIEMCGKFIARDRIHAFEGWFSATLLDLPVDTKFAMLHLDCRLVVGETTAAAAGDAFLFCELDWLRVKGKKEPIAIYETMAETDRPYATAYAAALEAYRKGNFQEAAAAWSTLTYPGEGDGPPDIMAARARHLTEDPPEAPWDAVWTKRTK